MRTDIKVSVAWVELVDSPISNSDATKLEDAFDGPDNHLRDSDFYAIGGRPAAAFVNLQYSKESNTVLFDIQVGDVSGSAAVEIGSLSELEEFEGTYQLRLGPEVLLIFDAQVPPGGEPRLLSAYTPDSFLFWSSRGRAGLRSPTNARELSTFDLLYVGIARVGDSFSRLIERGHKARMEILGAEPQRERGARVADETYLFFFRVPPVIMRSFGPETNFDDVDFHVEVDLKRWVKDAEKAFVKFMLPKYNRETYSNYPKGADGLSDQGFSRYGYAIAEDLAFRTSQGLLRGGRRGVSALSNSADFILVEGGDATLQVSGVDFDGSDQPK
jgi:hypothetical protein